MYSTVHTAAQAWGSHKWSDLLIFWSTFSLSIEEFEARAMAHGILHPAIVGAGLESYRVDGLLS